MNPPPRFAFLVHPLLPFHRRLLGVRQLNVPLALGGDVAVDGVGITGRIKLPTSSGPVDGVIVAVPDLADRLVADQSRALAFELAALRIAEREQVAALGLGNALAVVAGRGAELQRHTSVPVTTGQAATAWACGAIAREVLGEHGMPRGPVGVLGFAGTVGEAVALGFRARGIGTWVDATSRAAERKAADHGCEIGSPDEIVRTCRVIVGAATTGPVLDPRIVPADRVLVDLALPPTLGPGPRPPGLVVIAGERLRVPGRRRGSFWGRIWLELAPYGRRSVYACLAEPAAMAISGEGPFSGGRRLDLESVERVGALLLRLGFEPVSR